MRSIALPLSFVKTNARLTMCSSLVIARGLCYNTPMLSILPLAHGDLTLPAFLPDATLGVVRSVDSADLEQCGVQAVVMNTFHLMQRPGSTTVAALGGLHAMSGWPHPIITDSGGFQAYSLIRQNARYGSVRRRGIIFQPEGSERKLQLTPEKAIQLQLGYGADIVICLDYCTHVDDPPERQEESVGITIDWAKRSKAEFERTVGRRNQGVRARPLIFAVIQGGGSRDLRRRCAEELLAIGFDGFGYGGWPLDAKGNLLADMLAYTREVVPMNYEMHALGVGHPQNIADCFQLGYRLFDSAMPTRDARHGRLYTFTAPEGPLRSGGKWLSFYYVEDEKHIKSDMPISPLCDCLCCRRYSRGYLHHLFKIGDSSFYRLATMHNLRFMAMLMERLRS
jgi:queuine tRNA-ribosyltransferase